MTTVYINPHVSAIRDDNGIGRVIHAQYRLLPQYGIELVGSPDDAEIVAAHISGDGLPRVDILHCHGLYWTADPGSGLYTSWHHTANQKIIEAARQAYAITVPSQWVAMPFKRDMRISPHVIGHGIDLDQWVPGENKGYVLWNKNRYADVCDPTPAVKLAERGASVVTTFVRPGTTVPETLQIIGAQPFDVMRQWICEAGIYLATTKETFGIGTLEAMAAGVPVLGYAWGGTADLIEHERTGYLVRPGDIDGLAKGIEWIENHREELSANCREHAQAYAWECVIGRYADLYHAVAEQKRSEPRGVSIVITNYNYGRYVEESLKSCLDQTVQPEEILIVDDGSTDDSVDLLWPYGSNPASVTGKPYLCIHTQENAGVAAARNKGIAAATQPYVVCLDADDRLDPRFIQSLLPVMQNDRGLGIAYTGLKLLWPDGRETLSPFPPEFSWEQQATPGNPPPTCIPSGSMFRRAMWERAGGYQQMWAPGEDTEFWTRGLSVGFRAEKITEEPLFHYRLHEGQAHKTKQYQRIDAWHPWMRDKLFPMGAPAKHPVLVRSYSEPLISVIIPVGPGHVQYLPSALDSLLGQTFRNWEAIVVNDTPLKDDDDHWWRIAEVYPFAIRIRTAGEQGAGAARNLGLQHARGRFTLFLDADDYLMPDALFKMLVAFVESGGKYAYTDWLALHGDKTEPHKSPEFRQEAWLERGQHAITALLLTEDARGVQGFDEQMPGWEDWDFFIKLMLSGICGARVPEVLMGYRMHSGTRREESLRQKDALLGLLRQRYGDYSTGRRPMPGCCGGNSDAILQAKLALSGGPAAPAAAAPPTEQDQRGVETPATVRMEFIGPQVGAIDWSSADGKRRYRGGNNPHDRFVNALPQDIDHLESMGVWRRVQRVAAPGVSVVEAPTQPAPTVLPPLNQSPWAIPTETETPRSVDPPPPAPEPERPSTPVAPENPWGLPFEPTPEEEAAEQAANKAAQEHLRKRRRTGAEVVN